MSHSICLYYAGIPYGAVIKGKTKGRGCAWTGSQFFYSLTSKSAQKLIFSS